MKQSINWILKTDLAFEARQRKYVAFSSALWTILGAAIAFHLGISSINRDARPFVIGSILLAALAGVGASIAALRGMRHITILFLLLSVIYPTFFFWVFNVIPLALVGYLLYLPRKGRELTWKAIFVSIVGATLLVVVAGLVVTVGVGPARTPNSDLIVMAFKPVPFDLMTHCGINELRSNGRYFQRIGGILDDGSHNPPSGWGNPVQHGNLSVSGDIAVFRDQVGHAETFKVRPGATGFLNMCD